MENKVLLLSVSCYFQGGGGDYFGNSTVNKIQNFANQYLGTSVHGHHTV